MVNNPVTYATASTIYEALHEFHGVMNDKKTKKKSPTTSLLESLKRVALEQPRWQEEK